MNRIEIKATEHKVHAVTVFQANRAEVVRLFDVNLKPGQNEIEISQLPSILDQDSIRVDGVGHKAIIADVVYHASDRNAVDKETEKVVKELRNTRSVLRNQLDTYKGQASILETYSRTVNTKGMTKEQLAEFLEFYAEKRGTVDEKTIEWQGKVDKLDDEIQEKKMKTQTNEDARIRGVRIVVVVKAKNEGPARLALSYLISNAYWSPLYDLRAKLDSEKTPISLQYRATITQNTGEDWRDVELTLSTASTQTGGNIPTLRPQTIRSPNEINHQSRPAVRAYSLQYRNRYEPEEYDRGARRRSRSRSPAILESRRDRRSESPRRVLGKERQSSQERPIIIDRNRSRSGSRERRRMIRLHSRSPSPARFGIVNVPAAEGTMSTYYEIDGLSTIPTSTDNNKQEHKVTIAMLELPAEFQWITIPKEASNAFIQAKVKNISSYLLLPGRANIFLDDNFVTKSYIDHVSPNESFKCSLGVDPQVKITYHPRSKKTKSQGGLIGASMITISSFQKITIKNTRGTKLRRLLVRDQIPISADQRLRVILTEPVGLGPPSRTRTMNANTGAKPKEHTVARGVVARWMVNEDEAVDDGKIPGEDGAREGIVEWVCEIPSSQSIDLILAYDMIFASTLQWK